MIPKIQFKWSWIYEQIYHSINVKSEEYDYETYQRYIDGYITKVKEIWENIGEKVLKVISKESGLTWKEEKIICYPIKRSVLFPISDPLTIPIEFEGKEIFKLSHERFIDMLVHELIHNIMIQNEKKTGKYFSKIFDKYPREEFDTVIHIIVHAIHKKIILEVFDKKRLEKEIAANSFYPAYKRSWEIVNEKGEESIINEFKGCL